MPICKVYVVSKEEIKTPVNPEVSRLCELTYSKNKGLFSAQKVKERTSKIKPAC